MSYPPTQGFTQQGSGTQGFTQQGSGTQGSATLGHTGSAMRPIGPEDGHDIDEAPLQHLVGLMLKIREQNNAEKR
eukprot:COSAG06_NODE_33178_length_494_cov_0.600000_1_plen_74_part_01